MTVLVTTPAPPSAISRPFASLMLVGACACWGLSFPLMRALSFAQRQDFPACGSWFLSSWSLTLRFAFAALLLALWQRRRLAATTRSEMMQGLGLGVFTALGMLFQMDGLSYTDASVSAFLTQGTCIFVPLTLALRRWRLPPLRVAVACVLVCIGVAILADLDWHHLGLGRGESETLLGAAIFTMQILWLERPDFASNDAYRMSTMAFAVAALVYLPLALATMPAANLLFGIYDSPALAGTQLALTLICTFAGMLLMFAWQRHVGAVAAALIYCTEPIFASLYAFILPALLSAWLGIAYANEAPTIHLLIGGALILLANLVVQVRPSTPAR